MDQEEALLWAEYIALRGSLNAPRRLDRSIGELHYSFLKANGAKDITIYDILPHERIDTAPEDKGFDPVAIYQMLKANSKD